MNKAELIQALAARLDGDRRTAATAVNGLLEVIVGTVRAGESVALTGFGVFERRERAARRARNPRTGELVEVPATAVPAFRPGATFRDLVGGAWESATPGGTAPRGVPRSIRAALTATAATAAAPAQPPPAPDARTRAPAPVSGDRPGKPAKAKGKRAAKKGKAVTAKGGGRKKTKK